MNPRRSSRINRKKTRGCDRTPAERFLNAVIASVGSLVEHVIAGVKRCRLVKDVFRNTKAGFSDLAMALCCGLHNWRVSHRQPVPLVNLIEMSLDRYFQ